MGTWGACSDDYTCEQIYSISTQAANGGTSCPAADGDTQYCSNFSGCSKYFVDLRFNNLLFFPNLSLVVIISDFKYQPYKNTMLSLSFLMEYLFFWWCVSAGV